MIRVYQFSIKLHYMVVIISEIFWMVEQKELPVKSFPSYQRGIILENIMLTVKSKHKL